MPAIQDKNISIFMKLAHAGNVMRVPFIRKIAKRRMKILKFAKDGLIVHHA
jgi:hypothetical protein